MMRRECHPLDGVPVKITLRPPKAITVPSNFFKTDLPASLEQDYDFSLEYRVLQESQAERERQAKLEGLRPITAAPVNEFTTLTPSQPSSSTSPEETSPPTPSANISITEFEPEAFSPFDQVELQTINDLEELHSIFGGAKLSETTDLKPNHQKVVLPKVTDLSSTKNLFDGEQLKQIGKTHSTAPVASPFHTHSASKPPESIPASNTSEANVFDDLLLRHQGLAKELCAMGFPAQRVRHAVMDLGDDKGRVVEHLCLLGKLTDEGFEAPDVIQALRFMAHDYEKSRQFLISLQQLNGLGFSKDDIALALKLNNNDRDKALDELLKG